MYVISSLSIAQQNKLRFPCERISSDTHFFCSPSRPWGDCDVASLLAMTDGQGMLRLRRALQTDQYVIPDSIRNPFSKRTAHKVDSCFRRNDIFGDVVLNNEYQNLHRGDCDGALLLSMTDRAVVEWDGTSYLSAHSVIQRNEALAERRRNLPDGDLAFCYVVFVLVNVFLLSLSFSLGNASVTRGAQTFNKFCITLSFWCVIPAKAGIHAQNRENTKWIPAFAGMTNRWLQRKIEDNSVGLHRLYNE